MNKYNIRIAACTIAGVMAFSGYNTTLEAKLKNVSRVPVAGVAVVLDEGSTIEELQTEVAQNMAYLENASGIYAEAKLSDEQKNDSILVMAQTEQDLDAVNFDDVETISEGVNEAEQKDSVNVVEAATEICVTGEEQAENDDESDKAEKTKVQDDEIKAANDIKIVTLSAQKTVATGEIASKITEEGTDEVVTQEAMTENTVEAEAETQKALIEEDTAEKEDMLEESLTEETVSNNDAGEENATEETAAEETSVVQKTEEKEAETKDSKDKSEDDELRISAGFSAIGIECITKNTVTAVKVSEETEEASEESEVASEEQDFSNLVIAKVNNYVNVRSLPGEDGEIVGKLYDKSVGELIEEKDGWYKIKSGNCTGYVKGEYCVVGDEAEKLAKEIGTTYAIVNTTTLKVRQEASTESTVLGLVPIDEELVVVEELDGWVKIAIEEGDGYVSREYVKLRTDFVHAESKEEEEARLAEEARAREEARAAAEAAEEARASEDAQKAEKNQEVITQAQSVVANSQGSEMGKEVVDYAVQFIGNPYVYGGSSLTNGTDCSGFVMSVYANFGVSLPHSSSALRGKGYDVGGIQNAQPGDIVCYSGHVGIYMGNGQIVHASTKKTGIKVSDAQYRTILSVRRIF